MMRLFVCSFLSPANRSFYDGHMADVIASSGGLLRGIPRDSAHITYAFLPAADDRVLAEAMDAVAASASRCEPIEIRLGSPFILYAGRDARLVCAPLVQGEAELSRLSTDIVAELQRCLPEIALSGNRSPHVTLARFKRRTHRRSAAAISEAFKLSAITSEEREDRIAEAQTVSSELSSAGPHYVVKSSALLSAGQA